MLSLPVLLSSARHLEESCGPARDDPRTPDASPQNHWMLLQSTGRVEEQRRQQVDHVKAYVSAINSSDLHTLRSFILGASSPNCCTYVPQLNLSLQGLEGVLSFIMTFRSCFPDVCMCLDEVVPDSADPQRVCMRASCNGIQTVPLIPSLPIGQCMAFSLLCYLEFGNDDAKPTKGTYYFCLPDPLLTLIKQIPNDCTGHPSATSTDSQVEDTFSMKSSQSPIKPLRASIEFDFSGFMFDKYMADLEDTDVDPLLLGWLVANALSLSFIPEGSRLLQKAIDLVSNSEHCTLVSQFKGNVREAATSINANHVLQKCIELMPSRYLQFIVDELQGHVIHIAQNRCGCRVLERLLEHCPNTQVGCLVDEMLLEPLHHCRHPFANYVIQHILEYGSEEHRRRLTTSIAKDIHRLARHRLASNVVRSALERSDTSNFERLSSALCADPKALSGLQRHTWGSFVYRELKRSTHRQD